KRQMVGIEWDWNNTRHPEVSACLVHDDCGTKGRFGLREYLDRQLAVGREDAKPVVQICKMTVATFEFVHRDRWSKDSGETRGKICQEGPEVRRSEEYDPCQSG